MAGCKTPNACRSIEDNGTIILEAGGTEPFYAGYLKDWL
jgi:hypothetical protein